MGTQLYGYTPSEHEYSVTVPRITAGDVDVVIYVSAHGGGTVGKEYAGNGWDYLVTAGGETVLEGSDLRSPEGRAAGHAEMARSLASFLHTVGDSLDLAGGNAGYVSEYAGDYSAEQAAWLATQHDRMELFSMGGWIDAQLLERYPHGPYAVHACFPATGRELVQRNHDPASAVIAAEGFSEQGCSVHVSLDTCG